MASTVTAASLAALATATLPVVHTQPLPEIQARFHERIHIDGSRLDGDVTGRLTGAAMERGYEGATSLELEFNDPDMRILSSGLLSKQGKVRKPQFDEAAWAQFGDARLVLDDIAFRLAGVDPGYNAGQMRVTTRWEDEIAVLMRRKKGHRRFRRGDIDAGRWTRELVVRQLVVDSTGDSDIFGGPDAFAKQQPVKGENAAARRKAREKGLQGWRKLTIKGVRLDGEQKRNIETALSVADDQRASERATIAMLCAGIGESTFHNVVNSLGYGGVFQGQVSVAGSPNWFGPMGSDERTREEAKSFLLGGRGYQQGGAIKLAAANPDMGPGDIATRVEASGMPPGFYGQWATEAQTILDAWGGVGRVKVIEHPFYFAVGKDENYFNAADRFAQDVRWRFWVDENEAWFAPDDWLFQSATTLEIDPTMAGFRGISGTMDVGVPIGNVVLDVNIPRWVGSPAWRVELDGMGPLNGAWLLANHRQDLFTEDSTITLQRPAPALKEPAPTKTKIKQTETRPDSGSTRDLILQACERAYKQRSKYHYLQTRPMPSSLFVSGPVYIDCSAFATLAYKAGGADDPNGRGYDGQGYTGTLWANGEITNDPQPGDLAFYGNPSQTNSHVNVYAGDNTYYNMGPSAGLSKVTGKVRSDFRAYRTYGLS